MEDENDQPIFRRYSRRIRALQAKTSLKAISEETDSHKGELIQGKTPKYSSISDVVQHKDPNSDKDTKPPRIVQDTCLDIKPHEDGNIDESFKSPGKGKQHSSISAPPECARCKDKNIKCIWPDESRKRNGGHECKGCVKRNQKCWLTNGQMYKLPSVKRDHGCERCRKRGSNCDGKAPCNKGAAEKRICRYLQRPNFKNVDEGAFRVIDASDATNPPRPSVCHLFSLFSRSNTVFFEISWHKLP
jgi:hypothetical protein